MIAERFRAPFAAAPEVHASAPGRVNLIGEHTDYNEGFVLPMAIDRRVHVLAARRADGRIVAFAEEFSEQREISLSSRPTARDSRSWSDYVAAVASALTYDAGRTLTHDARRTGVSMLISGGVPVGAGLSSSAALELAVEIGRAHV